MRAAMIGLGMVSKTYADAIAGSDAVTLGPVFAGTPRAGQTFWLPTPGLAHVRRTV